MWRGLTIECFILFNLMAFLMLFNVVVSVLCRECIVLLTIFWKEYFDAKKTYLEDLAKSELSEAEEEAKRRSFN
jgi:hypothetical protein